jgi:hypothetical protein
LLIGFPITFLGIETGVSQVIGDVILFIIGDEYGLELFILVHGSLEVMGIIYVIMITVLLKICNMFR